MLDKDRLGSREIEDTHLPFFSLSKIITATDNFSNNNKLGEGGFGPVYKVSYAAIYYKKILTLTIEQKKSMIEEICFDL